MTKEEADKIVSRHEPLVVACTYNILFTNDIVMGLILEAAEAIKKTPLYKQKVKQLLKGCEVERRKYEKLVEEIIGDKIEFFADANEVFMMDVKQYVDTLFYSIKNELDKSDVPYSSAISKAQQACTMAGFACVQFDKRMEELKKTDIRLKKFSLQYLRLTTISHKLSELMDAIPINRTIDLNVTPASQSLDIVSKKLADVDSIAKAISV